MVMWNSKMINLLREFKLDSFSDTKGIKEELGENFLTVTPGIRPLLSDSNDQSRVSTPEEAVKNGSDFLVIGRPITGSQNPRATLEEINLKIA